MSEVWILQRDFTSKMKGFSSKKDAISAFEKHVENRLPGLPEDASLTDFYNSDDEMSCYYDGSFVASITKVEVE